jgi:hypothetical protein
MKARFAHFSHMLVCGGLYVNFGPVNGAVHLVVFVGQFSEVTVRRAQGMNLFDFLWEFFGKFVWGVGHFCLLVARVF